MHETKDASATAQPLVIIDADFQALIPPLEATEREELERSLLREGCRDRLVVWKDQGILIDGHNRHEICLTHGIPFDVLELPFATRDEAMLWMLRNQLGRRNIGVMTRGRLGMLTEEVVARMAKARQVERKGNQPGASLENSPKLEPLPPIDTRAEAAKAARMSDFTYRAVKLVWQAGSEKLIAAVDRAEVSVNAAVAVAALPKEKQDELVEKGEKAVIAAAKEARLAEREKKRASIEVIESVGCNLEDFAARGERFACVYADPPWRYGNQGTRAATDNHYPTMSVDEICDLPVASIVADNAHLHLWTTNAFLFDARRVMEAWGFTYKSCFVWVKPQMGIGNYWRVSHEFLLLGIRGDAPFGRRDCKSWGEFPRGRHSAKPDAIRQMVERVSPGPRIELFARERADGWSAWGNQIDITKQMFSQATGV